MFDFNDPKLLQHWLKNREKRSKEYRKLFNTPANLRLKYISFGAMVPFFALLLIMIFFDDNISLKAELFMRGCAGLFAIISIVSYATLIFRVHRAYYK